MAAKRGLKIRERFRKSAFVFAIFSYLNNRAGKKKDSNFMN